MDKIIEKARKYALSKYLVITRLDIQFNYSEQVYKGLAYYSDNTAWIITYDDMVLFE